MEASVLILDQNSSPCAAKKCGSLSGLLQSSLAVRCMQAHCDAELPESLASTPDLIVLRTSPFRIGTNLVADCKEKWCDSPLLLMFCSAVERRFQQSFLGWRFFILPIPRGELLSRAVVLKPVTNQP
jgi:hypothetical protein